MCYGKVPPSSFPFLKLGFVKRKPGYKLELKAVPCFYIGPSLNCPRDSMRGMLPSGAIIHSRHVTCACIRSLTPVSDSPISSTLGHEMGGSEIAELRSEEVEPIRVKSDASGRTKQTSGGRGATINQSASRLTAVRAKMRTNNCRLSSVHPCASSQGEGRAIAIVDSSDSFRRESRVTSTANNSGCFW